MSLTLDSIWYLLRFSLDDVAVLSD